jgi:hypothetical protein
MGSTRYHAKITPPDVTGWTWKQVVMAAANYIGTAIRELADVQRQAHAPTDEHGRR